MNIQIAIFVSAAIGALFGVAADRLSVRWPAHEEGATPRPIDWRTAVLALTGAVVFGGLVAHWSDPRDLAILLVISVALLLLLATDLDQKLLPDRITLPLIAVTWVLLVIGWSPLLADKPLGLISGISAGIGAPVLLFFSDRLLHGELGDGDLKLAAGIGLLAGVTLLVTGVLLASLGFSAVLIVLIALRRLGLRSAVPFGPVLIFATFVALLIA